jgi:hypothetical protein
MTDIPWQVGRAAVRAGNTLWREQLLDIPENYDRLAELHREAHVGWALDDGEYEEDEDYWCGVYAAWCYVHVGRHLLDNACVDLTLREDVARYMFASPERLLGLVTYSWADLDLPGPTEIDPDDARTGDIGLVVTSRSAPSARPHGNHVTLIADANTEGDTLATLEGNAGGVLPGGTLTPDGIEAVVHQTRNKDSFVHILRPQIEWFEGAYREELLK